MTRKSDALAKAVSARLPKFRASGSFLYRRDPALMLRGFAFDMPPGGCYVWKYCLPLFQDADFLHMSLGYRMDAGYIAAGWKSVSRLAAEASAIVIDNDDFAEVETLDELVQFADDRRVGPTERDRLHRSLRIFETEPPDSIGDRASAVRARLGID